MKKDLFLPAKITKVFTLDAGEIRTIQLTLPKEFEFDQVGYPIRDNMRPGTAFLTKSFSKFSRVRFNAVGPGLLKTSASAGIPGYVDSYLYAEQVIPRGQAIQTQEAANVAAFLLSPRSSGITAQTLVVDAGMSTNYFDGSVIERTMRDS